MVADELLVDFVSETKSLIGEMQTHLEKAEAGMAQAKSLEDFGQRVDRIMGGARSLAVNMTAGPKVGIETMADYAAVCKAVGYKASQIKDNENFYTICVAVLMDATDVMAEMLEVIGSGKELNLKSMISQTLIDRVKWVSSKFSADYKESVSTSGSTPSASAQPIGEAKKTGNPMSQNEIDALMAKLGL